MSDILKSFNELMNHFFLNINGCLVERNGKKFIWNRRSYDSIIEVKKAIQEADKVIYESIKK